MEATSWPVPHTAPVAEMNQRLLEGIVTRSMYKVQNLASYVNDLGHIATKSRFAY